MNNTDFLFVEKYRPQKINDCILPENIKQTLQEYVDKKEIPNLLFIGSAGQGKTSAALALCKEVGCDYLFINASDENGIDTLRVKITNYASTVSISGGRKVVILDEFDGTTSSFQEAFRHFLEAYSKNCTFILTANFSNKIVDAIYSRCATIDFKVSKADKLKLIKQVFKRICFILDKENIPYNKEALVGFISKYYPDNRRILNELQRYSIKGSIDVGILSQIGEINLKQLITALKDKNLAQVREWVVENLDNDVDRIWRKLYDGMKDFIKPNSIPQFIAHIGEFQFRTSFVSDPEIQLVHFFTLVIADIEFL